MPTKQKTCDVCHYGHNGQRCPNQPTCPCELCKTTDVLNDDVFENMDALERWKFEKTRFNIFKIINQL